MKDRQINVRVNQEILNILELKAKASNMSKTEYVTRAILDSEIKVTNNSKDISKLIGSINKIGNNINQIARNLNVANKQDKLDYINYDNILDKLIIIQYQLNEILKSVK